MFRSLGPLAWVSMGTSAIDAFVDDLGGSGDLGTGGVKIGVRGTIGYGCSNTLSVLS